MPRVRLEDINGNLITDKYVSHRNGGPQGFVLAVFERSDSTRYRAYVLEEELLWYITPTE